MSTCDPSALANLYDWLESIPFSRPKKNFARDFSDGILAAELIQYFFPSLVEIHNYPPSNSVAQKRINWSTLNHKVLKKLDFPLSDVTIHDLASGSKRECTEYFLDTLREKIDSQMKKLVEKMKKRRDSSQDVRKENVDGLLSKDFEDLTSQKNLTRMGDSASKKTSQKTLAVSGLKDSNLESVPRDVYDQKVQELLACEEQIQVLKARIHRLENMLQLKNVTIERQLHSIEKLKAALPNVSSNKVQENKLFRGSDVL